MSEDYQWRQLGSIVNEVLMDTRTKAIRAGIQSKVAPRPALVKAQQKPATVTSRKLGHGFLNPDYEAPAAPAQLELPFGISASSDFGKSCSPKNARLV